MMKSAGPAINSPSFFIGKEEEGMISFGSGQPDLPPPKESFSILPEYKDFKYGPVQGDSRLRQELASQYPSSNAGSFVITNGASEALDLIFRFLARKGKAVLIPRPYYYTYPHLVRFAGLEVRYYDLVGGKIEMENFKKNLAGCVGVLINSPSNPTGSIQEVETLREIEQMTQKTGTYVVSDEVYKDLIYERENYLIQGEHVITVNSFSKTFAMCGFRIGYLFSTDPEVVDSCVEMKTHTSMNTNILGQEMALAACRAPDNYVREQVAVWKERRDRITAGLKDLGLDLWRPEGAFYVFPKFKSANRVVNDLFYKYRMITYDGTWFGDPERVRFSYALDTEKIREGLSRLKEFLSREYRNY